MDKAAGGPVAAARPAAASTPAASVTAADSAAKSVSPKPPVLQKQSKRVFTVFITLDKYNCTI